MNSNQIPQFPPAAKKIVNQIENKDVLGASKHVSMIVEACNITSQQSTAVNSKELIDLFSHSMQYFIQTRGTETIAVRNAFDQINDGFDKLQDAPIQDTKKFIDQQCNQYIEDSKKAILRIAKFGGNLLSNYKSILVFDYSSTVVAILNWMSGVGYPINLVVPECRLVNGGRAVLEQVNTSDHKIHFIPDVGIGNSIKEVDAVLVGVETVFSDGSFTNTLGTNMITVLARANSVPVYAATELLKVDVNSISGSNRDLGHQNLDTFSDYLGNLLSHKKVSIRVPLVDLIPANNLDAYITECGIINPSVAWIHAKKSVSMQQGCLDV